MLNLGIIIAVEEYNGDLSVLPGCRTDGAALATILSKEQRFDELLIINNSTNSKNVKCRLRDFIKRFENQAINEIVFYFSGHGDYADEEFYYLLTDYQKARLKTTSLENSELDTLVRSLKPKLFVKIVDACHSGITYIKNSDDLKKYLRVGSGHFDKLYFMFSSRADQSSYQKQHLSDFTASIVRAISSTPSGHIRYKDLIDSVSDEFQQAGHQTPFFVTQSDFTDVFCEASQDLKDALNEVLLVENPGIPGEGSPSKTLSIIDLVKNEASSFCSKEEACAVAETIFERVNNRLTDFLLSKGLAELFSIELNARNDFAVPSPADIGLWLNNNNKAEPRYFAEATIDTKIVKKNVTNMGLSAASPLTGAMHYVDETQSFVAGFRTTGEMPYDYIIVTAKPKFANLQQAELFILPVFSRTHVRLFWACTHYEDLSWTESKRVGGTKWSTADAPLKMTERIDSLVRAILLSFEDFLVEPIRAKWGRTDTPESHEEQNTEQSPEQTALRLVE
jgi:hypothetical protein